MTPIIPENFDPRSAQSNYTKLTAGKHRLRILGPAIVGYLWWTEDKDGTKRPTRIPIDENPPVSEAGTVKRFLTFPVWSYQAGRIQILEVTQASIQGDLKALQKDPDWGDLSEFDIEITREGVDLQSTRYRVSPKPKSSLPEEAIKEINEKGLPKLEALFLNADPFAFGEPESVSEKEMEDLPF